MRVADLGEFGLLGTLGLFGAPLPAGWLGPGDDAAVLPPPGEALLVTTDLLVEDVHFRRTTTSPRDLGYKALAASASDVAAMGGRPLAFVLGLTLPGESEVAWVAALYQGLGEAAREFGCPLVGGDTTAGASVTLAVTALGLAPGAGAIPRSGARPGQDLFVTGWPGESGLGLALLERGAGDPGPDEARLVARHRRPAPRLALGRALGDGGLATALIDVSDGLLQDLGHLMARSGVGAEVWLERLPLSAPLTRVAARLGVEPLTPALGGGEDYELLFFADPARRRAIFAAARAAATPVRRIGRATAGAGLRLLRGGAPAHLPPRAGFDHFRAPR